jgi:hypothetical protein
MTPGWKTVCFVAAIVLAVVASVWNHPRVALHPLALAAFVLPFAWDAAELAGD